MTTSKPLVSLSLALLAGIVPMLGVSIARADPPPGVPPIPDPGMPAGTVTVQSGPNGVTIYIAITQTTPGSSGGSPSTTTSASTGSQPSCSVEIMNIGSSLSAWLQQQAPLHPGMAPWSVVCDNGFFNVAWVPIDAAAGGNVSVVVNSNAAIPPVSVAQQLLDQLPIPNIAVRANPSTGLVALASWFWADGYGGAPIAASETLGKVTVDVEVEPQSYTWSFGDGASMVTTSLGEPYPAQSDITHVYQQSSLTAGGAYSVTLTVTFSAKYRVNGGAWQALAPITRSFTTGYPVQQLQSVLTGG